MSDYIKVQLEERARAYEAAKEILDRAASENRSLDAAERESVDRAFADMDKRKAIIDDIQALEARKAEVAEVVAGAPEARGIVEPVASDLSDDQLIRSLAKGEIRSATFERRSVTKSATGAPVPTRFYDRVVELMRYTGPMLDESLVTMINSTDGANLQIPRTNAYSVGSVTSEGNIIGPSDPTFQAFMTLGAFKYSFITQVSLEMIEDSGVDLLGYLGTNTGQGIGYAVNSALTTGTGTVQPNGIVSSGSVAITGGTGVSGAFTYANVVDLVYSLNTAVRMMPSFRISGGASSIAALRKLTNPAGYYVFEPALQAGTPDRVLGYPLVENPHIAAPAVNAKSLIAGDFKSFWVRTVGGIRLDRSDDFAFSSGLATFRATLRVDGGLPQPTHVAVFQGGTA